MRPYNSALTLAEQILQLRADEELAELWEEGFPSDLEAAQVFVLERLSDPFSLLGMREAVETLLPLLERSGTRILIHGDYDTDGVTATAILYHFFQHFPIQIEHYIPDRLEEGYGLSEAGVQKAIDFDADLLLTVDCGAQSFDEVQALKQAGIQVVVTDHHQCAATLPVADAVVNPNRPDEVTDQPLKTLAGAGVAFKLIQALCMRLSRTDLIFEAIDLVAIGTVGDLMTLRGENRLLVQLGLLKLRTKPRLGLLTLLNAVNQDLQILNAQTLGFTISPRINACGRMASVEPALQLLLENRDLLRAQALVEEIEAYNLARRSEEQRIMEEVFDFFRVQPERLDSHLLVVYGEGWHPGVLGIVASRILSYFKRPCVVLTYDEEKQAYCGSARAMAGVNLLAYFESARSYLNRYGGHHQAAGLEVKAEHLEAFCVQMRVESEALASSFLAQKQGQEAELAIPMEACTLAEAQGLAELEPFGRGNEEPLFEVILENWQECRALGQSGKVLRLVFTLPNGERLVALSFLHGDLLNQIQEASSLRTLAHLRVEQFRQRMNPILRLEAIEVCGGRQEEDQLSTAVETFYQQFDGLSAARLAAPFDLEPALFLPNAQLLGQAYRSLYKLLEGKQGMLTLERWQRALPEAVFGHPHLASFLLRRCLDLYSEAGLLFFREWTGHEQLKQRVYYLAFLETSRRVQLSEMPTYQKLKQALEEATC